MALRFAQNYNLRHKQKYLLSETSNGKQNIAFAYLKVFDRKVGVFVDIDINIKTNQLIKY